MTTANRTVNEGAGTCLLAVEHRRGAPVTFNVGLRRDPMRRTWTIIGVGDVLGSFKWYQSLLGLPETAPAHYDFKSSTRMERSCSAFTSGVPMSNPP